MTSQAQIQANRRNAQKSTGPKTPEGKARVSLNALKHGIRARAIIDQLQRTPLWEENPQEFAAFAQSLTDHFKPEGPYEEMCVEDIAINQWHLRRLARVETGHIASAQRLVMESEDCDNPRLRARTSLPDLDTLEKLTRYEVTIRRLLNRSFDTLVRLQTERLSGPVVATRDLPSLSTTSPSLASPSLTSPPSVPLSPSLEAVPPSEPNSILDENTHRTEQTQSSDEPVRTNYYERMRLVRQSASEQSFAKQSQRPSDGPDAPPARPQPASPATSPTQTADPHNQIGPGGTMHHS